MHGREKNTSKIKLERLNGRESFGDKARGWENE
jgi:hypothetical protein